MKKDDFKKIFEEALEEAARFADSVLEQKVPRAFQIKLYGAGVSGDLLPPDIACDKIYLNSEEFYRIIDVSLVEVGSQTSTIFVRVSGHKPSKFEETWNTPKGKGPFKQLASIPIKVTASDSEVKGSIEVERGE